MTSVGMMKEIALGITAGILCCSFNVQESMTSRYMCCCIKENRESTWWNFVLSPSFRESFLPQGILISRGKKKNLLNNNKNQSSHEKTSRSVALLRKSGRVTS
jgi:hypothetical protein